MKSSFKDADLSVLDFEDLLKVVTQIQKSRSREELQASLRERVLPLLQEDAAAIQDESRTGGEGALIACPGIQKEDRPLIQEYLKQDALMRLLLTESEHTLPISPRGEKILKWVAPQLMHKIKSLIMEEELYKSNSIAQVLMKSPAGIGLIDGDMRVVTCNKAFQDIFEVIPREPVPDSLSKLLEKETTAPHTNGDSETSGTEIPFFTLPQGNYKVIYYQLESKTPESGTHWLVRIYPSVDPFSKSNLLIQKAGLTWREMEICCLIHDGLGRHEIAERLFISAHTVKTHLKKIHKKLGVNSRTQLVAYLNQHSDDHFEKKYT